MPLSDLTVQDLSACFDLPARDAAKKLGMCLTSLKKLMDALEATEAHFIRCIKPNNELRPNRLYGAFVLNQRKCSGTLEACLLYTSPSPRDLSTSRMPSSA